MTEAEVPGRHEDFAPQSRVADTVDALGDRRRALLFAELSKIAYLDPPEAAEGGRRIGLAECAFFDRGGAQAYLFGGSADRVLVFRGTEPNDWNDLRADADALAAAWETLGRVHRGFKRELDELWALVGPALEDDPRPLWCTGHSLGGALATLAAARLWKQTQTRQPRRLITFGAPRVGDRAWRRAHALPAERWVHNNDVVVTLPPALLGYVHLGEERYLDAEGRLRTLSPGARALDRLWGLLTGLLRGSLDPVDDHSIDGYIEALRRLC